MAVTLTKDLTTICAGYGDMKITFSKGSGDTAQEVSAVYGGVTYTASFYNNVAVIDLHGKGLESVDNELDISSSQGNTSLTIYRNPLLVGAFSNVDLSKSYYPLNMSQQIGQDNNFSVDKISLCKQIRTNLSKIKRYTGYERRVAVLCIPQAYGAGYGLAYIKIDGTDKGFLLGPNPLFLLDASEANSSIEIKNNSIPESIQVEVLAAPEHPFYVRWVNALAGWDYWMFDCRYVKKRKIGSRKTVERYITDLSVASGNKQTIGLEVEEEVTVGASQITEEEFECISALLYSTFVQWYDESRGKWIDVLPDGEASFLKGSPRTDIEITFILPERQLQMI